jgi:hypothetical protein
MTMTAASTVMMRRRSVSRITYGLCVAAYGI